MQNLTAHYNILFNANEILRQKQEAYALAFIDSYTEILNVYQDTAAKTQPIDKDLQTAIDKGNKIINIKEQSHYLGDAYLVLGKANFLAGEYFNAAEYFTYVINSFPKQTNLTEEAAVWKARTLIYLNQLPLAKQELDTAMQNVNPKKSIAADVYATRLQYDIDVQDYAGGEEMAKQAVSLSRNKNERLRWTFILAQLQELNQKNAEAYINYTKIAKSNAAFEMAFNADLNRIRIEDEQNGVKTSRIDKLQSLLKNPNNKDFKDQIYYQVAQIYLAGKDIDNALKNYKLSVRSSVKDQNQKGLSYLRIADINFNSKADYVTAKKYYDSTLTTLSPNYPGYIIIQKKTNNLQLLTDRLQIIAREDTLQMLARLDETTRQARIDTMVTREVLQRQAVAANAAADNPAGSSASGGISAIPGGGNSSFYFYNSKAVSQGYSDFKRIWGSRKLEDNWRRSSRTSTVGAQAPLSATQATIDVADPFAKTNDVKSNVAADYRQQIVKNLPLTPELLAQSNLKIYNAYTDIANFYRDILEDKKGAIAAYQLILDRFPGNPNLPAIYYSLYRLYTELNDAKAGIYKDKLLKDYPETPFAKVILDPDYSKKLGDKDAEFATLYSQVYDLYAHRKYPEVIKQATDVMKQYPGNKYSAQLDYLRVIAAGHQEPVTPFKLGLEQITKNYPDDKLITPLVNQHLDYINANLVDMSARHYALTDADTSGVLFTPPVENKEETPYRVPGRHYEFGTVPDVRKPDKKPEAPKTDSAKKAGPDILLSVKKPENKKPTVSSIFSLRDSTNYYFVINIAYDNTNLSSSRFGIGQFNRANLPGDAVKHLLMDVGNNNRLIYVGRFYSVNAVKAYARAIIPLMPEIMKIPKDKYSFFIITKENLDKLADKKTLDSYIDYYQNNY